MHSLLQAARNKLRKPTYARQQKLPFTVRNLGNALRKTMITRRFCGEFINIGDAGKNSRQRLFRRQNIYKIIPFSGPPFKKKFFCVCNHLSESVRFSTTAPKHALLRQVIFFCTAAVRWSSVTSQVPHLRLNTTTLLTIIIIGQSQTTGERSIWYGCAFLWGTPKVHLRNSFTAQNKNGVLRKVAQKVDVSHRHRERSKSAGFWEINEQTAWFVCVERCGSLVCTI